MDLSVQDLQLILGALNSAQMSGKDVRRAVCELEDRLEVEAKRLVELKKAPELDVAAIK